MSKRQIKLLLYCHCKIEVIQRVLKQKRKEAMCCYQTFIHLWKGKKPVKLSKTKKFEGLMNKLLEC